MEGRSKSNASKWRECQHEGSSWLWIWGQWREPAFDAAFDGECRFPAEHRECGLAAIRRDPPINEHASIQRQRQHPALDRRQHPTNRNAALDDTISRQFRQFIWRAFVVRQQQRV